MAAAAVRVMALASALAVAVAEVAATDPEWIAATIEAVVDGTVLPLTIDEDADAR